MKWKAPFSGNDILPHAREWAEYHRRHEAYWAGRHAVKNDEMKQTARTEWTPVTGGEQGVIRYDQGLQQQVNDANNRRNSHKTEAENYEAYALMFEKKPDLPFVLDAADVAYFFKAVPVDDLPVELPVVEVDEDEWEAVGEPDDEDDMPDDDRGVEDYSLDEADKHGAGSDWRDPDGG